MPYSPFNYYYVMNKRNLTFAEKMQAHADRLSWLAERIDRKERLRKQQEWLASRTVQQVRG